MSTLPPFSVLRANYPSKSKLPTRLLLDSIGGQVATLRDSVNTCALRMSVCLRNSGAPLEHLGGLTWMAGKTASPGDHHAPPAPRFIIRVHDMRTYLQRVYGPGSLIYDARVDPMKIHLGGRRHVQGILVFEWLGPLRQFGATGHVDLFSVVDQGPDMKPRFVPACEGECFWLTDPGPMIAHLWEARP
jgi:hypothetical protein